MKARVKATGKIVEVKYSRQMGPDAVYRDLATGEHYMDFELSFLPEDGTPDYWTRFKHQAAIAAMQGLMSYVEQITPKEGRSFCDEIVDISFKVAHALVEKYKKEERK